MKFPSIGLFHCINRKYVLSSKTTTFYTKHKLSHILQNCFHISFMGQQQQNFILVIPTFLYCQLKSICAYKFLHLFSCLYNSNYIVVGNPILCYLYPKLFSLFYTILYPLPVMYNLFVLLAIKRCHNRKCTW